MLSSSDHYFQIPKNIDFKIGKRGLTTFLQPDLSEAVIFNFDKRALKILRFLKSKKASFLQLSKRISASAISEKKTLWRLLQTLKKHHLVENLTATKALRPKYFNDHCMKLFSRQLIFFSSYEDKNNSRYDYQSRLLQAHVGILGLGGIGCVVLDGLVRAGVGKFTILDQDKIAISNLTRQILFSSDDLSKKKVEVASRKAKKINPAVTIIGHDVKILKKTNLEKYFKNIDLLIICCDEPSMEKVCDFVTPFCISKNMPYILGGGYSAHIGALPRTIIPKRTVCWECHKKYIKKRNKSGVRFSPFLRINGGSLSAIAGIIGNLTVLEAIKVLTGFANPSFANRIGEIRFTDLKIKSSIIKKNIACAKCGEKDASY